MTRAEAELRLADRPLSRGIKDAQAFAVEWQQAQAHIDELVQKRPLVIESLLAEGLTYGEVAVVINLSVDAVYKIMQRHRSSQAS